jgi:F0F1-type ATP synthase assembly protein I
MFNDRPQSGGPPLSRYANMGVEFAAAVMGFSLLGWWIDYHWHIERHWGVVVCGLLGVVGGLYNLLRQAIAAAHEANRHVSPGSPKPDKDSAQKETKSPNE